METSALLTSLETCPRKGYYSRSWEKVRLSHTQMLTRALRSSLQAPEGIWGEIAGSEVLQLAEDRGLETSNSGNIYSQVIHIAALADILVSAIRKPHDPPWIPAKPMGNWMPGCWIDQAGANLHRLVLVSNWTEERHYAECHAWGTLGEMAHYNLPMKLVIAIIGQQRLGKRTGPWVSGFIHPRTKQLRFRKKSRSTSETFTESWEKIYREDHDEISRETWLNSMLKDDVLPEVLFRVDMPTLPEVHRQRILDMAHRKMDHLASLQSTPEANISTCDWPVPCQFRPLCHSLPEREPSEKNGFVRIPQFPAA